MGFFNHAPNGFRLSISARASNVQHIFRTQKNGIIDTAISQADSGHQLVNKIIHCNSFGLSLEISYNAMAQDRLGNRLHIFNIG